MKLNAIQIEVLNSNLSKASELAESLYQASINPFKDQTKIKHWRGKLDVLSILLDDMRGAYYRLPKNSENRD